MKLAVIWWTDAAMHGTSQRSFAEAKECGLVEGIAAGFIVYEDKKQITLALDWFPEDNQFRQLASYPKSGIKKIKRTPLV